MNENLLLLFKANPNFKKMEDEMIVALNPLLNIQQNHNPVNEDYRSVLSELRNNLSDLE